MTRKAPPLYLPAQPVKSDPVAEAGKARQRALIRAVLASLEKMGARISVGLSGGYEAQPGFPVRELRNVTIHLRYVPVPASDMGHIWGPQRDKAYDERQEAACTSAALKLAKLGYTATYIPPSPGHAWFMPQVLISAGSVDLTPYSEE